MQNVFRTNTIDTYDVTHDFRHTDIDSFITQDGSASYRGYGYTHVRPEWACKQENDNGVQVAFDSIHGEYCVAIGSRTVPVIGAPTIVVAHGVTEAFNNGVIEECYVLAENTSISNTMSAIPGPGYLIHVSVPSGGTKWYCMQSFNPAIPPWTLSSWIAKEVLFDGTNLTFLPTATMDTFDGTILEIRTYCDKLTDFVMPTFPNNKALSVLVYTGVDTLSGDIVLAGPTGVGQYVQFVCPATSTKHSWPAYIWLNRSYKTEVQSSFRYITNPSNGYIFQSNDPSKKRRIHIEKNVMTAGGRYFMISRTQWGSYLDLCTPPLTMWQL
jgi:hypothetical protein